MHTPVVSAPTVPTAKPIATAPHVAAGRIKLSRLGQKDGKSIAEIQELTKELTKGLPRDKIDVGMATLKGMRDEDKRSRVINDGKKDQGFSFATIQKLVTAGIQ